MSILTDVHTHTTFSTDGVDDIFTMLAKAKDLTLTHWGISEHFDYDYLVDGISFDGQPAQFTDAQAYFSTARTLQAKNKNVHILVGAEFGFTRNKAANGHYHALINGYQPDFIVNSVHTQGKYDYYQKEAFLNKDKAACYLEYLALVRESLDVDYAYDIVGHLGYPSRFAPYADKNLYYEDFAPALDDILTAVIKKDKILEINTSVKGLDLPFLPHPQIVARYFALGGRRLSFASDAHGAQRLCDGRERAVAILKEMGFTCFTLPCRGEKTEVPF